jgi:hypothetical protein
LVTHRDGRNAAESRGSGVHELSRSGFERHRAAYSFIPNPPPKEQRVAFNALKKALADFSRRSTSVAGDFDIFLAAATHLVPIQKAGSPDPTESVSE